VRPNPLPSILLACSLAACGDAGGASESATADDTTASSTTTSTTTSATSTGASTGAPTTGDVPDTSTGDSTSTSDAPTSSTTDGSDTTGSDTTGAVASSTTDASTSTTDASTSTTDASSTGGDQGLGQAAQDLVAELEAAVDGVLYMSEGEDTWHVVAFADVAPVTEANLKDIIKDVYVQNPNEQPLIDRTIEVRSFPWLFDPITVPQPWWDDGYYMQAEVYAPIRMLLETKLVNLQVFRLGEQQGNVLQGAIDVYVLGETGDGDIVGMWSTAIET